VNEAVLQRVPVVKEVGAGQMVLDRGMSRVGWDSLEAMVQMPRSVAATFFWCTSGCRFQASGFP